MADQWDFDCDDSAAATVHCDACINVLAEGASDVVDALLGPVVVALDSFTDALTPILRRLKWGVRKLLSQVEATAVALGPMPSPGMQLGVADAPGPSAMSVDDTPRPPRSTAGYSVDWDQPNVLLFGERNQPWHQLMLNWWGGGLDAFYNSGTLQKAIDARTAAFPPAEPSPFDATGEIPDIG